MSGTRTVLAEDRGDHVLFAIEDGDEVTLQPVVKPPDPGPWRTYVKIYENGALEVGLAL